MHFLFVVYRCHESLLGGAELHHRRLALELQDKGHQVTILTGDGKELRNFCHWGVLWTSFVDPSEKDNEFKIRRLALSRHSKFMLALKAKKLQKLYEKEQASIQDQSLKTLLSKCDLDSGVYLLNGFHHPEINADGASRWTHKRFRILLHKEAAREGMLTLHGFSPSQNLLRISINGEQIKGGKIKRGSFSIPLKISDVGTRVLTLETGNVYRPMKDFRGLGVNISGIEYQTRSKQCFYADVAEDAKSLGRKALPELIDFYTRQAMDRDEKMNQLFMELRGPQLRNLRKAIEEINADQVIHCNLPWENMTEVEEGELTMPLWHVDDEFYYWKPWIESLQRGRLALANTPWTAEQFFPQKKINAAFVGPPIWEPDLSELTAQDRETFRGSYGINKGETLIITVCRKSPEKRYEAIGSSIQRLREKGVPVKMLGIGPDVDGRPFKYDGATWIGPLRGDELQVAYHSCDAFAFMSESESFGMVIPESWHHRKPVIVNRLCRPAASLIRDGIDGLLASPGKELDNAIERIVNEEKTRISIGEEGYKVAQEKYRRGSSAERLLQALDLASS